MMRIIAVDWSGAKSRGGAKNIALAEARDGELVHLELGIRGRDQIVDRLIELRDESGHLVVGLDFAFSFPGWYLRQQTCASAREMWSRLAHGDAADQLLANCAPPFWGLKGTSLDRGVEPYRVTERNVKRAEGVTPKSIFHISGSGTVGTGSIRGMRSLHALQDAGFSIWPFDDPGNATIVEVYPRLFAPRVPDNVAARAAHLDALDPPTPGELREVAKWSDDAFDATVSAIAMSQHAAELSSLPRIEDDTLRLEGIIWWPGWRSAHNF